MAENILLPSYTGVTQYDYSFGVYALSPGFADVETYVRWHGLFDLAPIEGNIFVEFDGVTYECAQQRLAALDNAMAIGNCAPFGGTGNNEPFVCTILSVDTGDGNYVYPWAIGVLGDTAPTEHTVEVYQDEASTAFAVVLKDRSGANVTYEVPSEQIKLNTPNGTQIFTAGQAVDNVSVTLDLADGDQTVTAGDGQLIKSAIIQKPATLVPANIVKDVDIAGVVGTFEGGGGGDAIAGKIIDGTFSGSLTNSICTRVRNGIFSSNANLTAVDFPACTSIDVYAFTRCTNLTEANFPACVTISTYAFQSCSSLRSINFPACTSVGGNAFNNCSELTEAIFPSCTSVANGAFYWCKNLTIASFPMCTSVGANAFSGCSNLSIAYFPKLSLVANAAFAYCVELKSIYFPAVTSISASGFQYITSGWTELNSSAFPICTYLGSSAFTMNYNLLSVYFPMVTYIGLYAFSECKKLRTAIFPVCSTIGDRAFERCYSLASIYLFSTSVVSISGNTFTSTPIRISSYLGGVYGSVYVRESLADLYKTATNWSAMSKRIVGLTDEQIAAILEG